MRVGDSEAAIIQSTPSSAPRWAIMGSTLTVAPMRWIRTRTPRASLHSGEDVLGPLASSASWRKRPL